MFVRQNQQQFRNSNADVQIFYGDGSNSTSNTRATWNKPPGVSHFYMMMIGAGGDGNGTTAGGSGAITVFYCAAQNIPDNLFIWVGKSGADIYVSIDPTGNSYFQARSGTTNGGSTTAANALASMGFYQSIAGQNGSTGDPGASTTTFLSGGGASTSTLTANYGYGVFRTGSKSGFFQMQPIIVGAGGAGSGIGGIGCGGGANATTGKGGPGMVLIASW